MLSKLLEEKGEFELKYTFPNHCRAILESWLAVSCKRDKSYPTSIVQSIYLETTLAESYQEKVNSDFFKTKYRVRWYETEDGRPFVQTDNVPVFLETDSVLQKRWCKVEKLMCSPVIILQSSPWHFYSG